MSEITPNPPVQFPIVRVGADLAKSVIQVHAVDTSGKRVTNRALPRDKFIAWCAQLPAGCLIAMEASSSAHHWARKLALLGLDARIIAAHLVSPYRLQGKSGKNDANDAAAICEAASRPSMHFVPIKTTAQQGMLCVHRLREGLKEERTASTNRIRGLLAEFGAWLGLTPRQNSSGGKNNLGGITKRGDMYLRMLFIQGAKSVVMTAHTRDDPISQWVFKLREKSGWQKAAVAMANKNARILWAVMTKGQSFDARHVSIKPGMPATAV